jgi:hypothetical protein
MFALSQPRSPSSGPEKSLTWPPVGRTLIERATSHMHRASDPPKQLRMRSSLVSINAAIPTTLPNRKAAISREESRG